MRASENALEPLLMYQRENTSGKGGWGGGGGGGGGRGTHASIINASFEDSVAIHLVGC